MASAKSPSSGSDPTQAGISFSDSDPAGIRASNGKLKLNAT